MAEGGCILEAAVELVRCADCRTGPAPEAARLRALAPQPYAEAAPRCGAASAYGDHEGAGARPGDAPRPFVRKPRGGAGAPRAPAPPPTRAMRRSRQAAPPFPPSSTPRTSPHGAPPTWPQI